MNKLLSVYYTPTHASITVENGVQRVVSGSNMVDVLHGLDPDSLGVLVAFCRAVCQTVDEPTHPSMFIRK